MVSGILDGETLSQIMEDPYAQYFLGFEELNQKPIRSISISSFSKTLGVDQLDALKEMICKVKCNDKHESDDDDSNNKTPQSQSETKITSTNDGESVIFNKN